MDYSKFERKQMNQTKINVYDKLLYYLSHEGELSWEKFKAAVDKLTDYQPPNRPSTYLRFIARLGHLDYDPLNLTRVVVTPAAIVETTVPNRYVLVGSRTPDFINEIDKCVSDTGGKLRKISDIPAPTIIVLSDLTEDSFNVIESFGIHISRAFSAKLSKLLPILKSTSFPLIETPLQNVRSKFNTHTLKFDKLNNQSSISNGLYGISQPGPDIYILKYGSDQRKVPRDWGVWLLLSNAGITTGLVTYEKETEILCVKRPLQLPLILDRCAILCSGFPPKYENGFCHYSNVPEGIAYQLTKSLHQNWEK